MQVVLSEVVGNQKLPNVVDEIPWIPGCKLHVDVELPHVVGDPHPSVVGGQLVEEVAGDDRDRGRRVKVNFCADSLDERVVVVVLLLRPHTKICERIWISTR